MRWLLSISVFFLGSISIYGQGVPPKPPTVTAAEIEAERKPNLTEVYRLLGLADRIVVSVDTDSGPRVLFESADPRDINELRDALKLVEPDYWRLSICAEPTISIYSSGEKVLSVSNVLGSEVKTSVWRGNAPLADPEKWIRWFDDRGMSMVRQERDEAETEARLYEAAEAKWLGAIPKGLNEDVEKARSSWGLQWNLYDFKPMKRSLERHFPTKNAAIRALLEWYGSSSNTDSWSGAYSHEAIPEELLLLYSTKDLISAIERSSLTALETEGAARLFASWAFGTRRPADLNRIPSQLRKRLLDHSMKTGGPEKQDRARAAFGPRGKS